MSLHNTHYTHLRTYTLCSNVLICVSLHSCVCIATNNTSLCVIFIYTLDTHNVYIRTYVRMYIYRCTYVHTYQILYHVRPVTAHTVHELVNVDIAFCLQSLHHCIDGNHSSRTAHTGTADRDSTKTHIK